MRDTASLSDLSCDRHCDSQPHRMTSGQKTPAAIVVAFALQDGQHVFAGKQPAERQAVVSGKFVADDSGNLCERSRELAFLGRSR